MINSMMCMVVARCCMMISLGNMMFGLVTLLHFEDAAIGV